MSSSWCFLFFLSLSLFQTCFLSSPSDLSAHLCLHEERHALLQLKQKHYHHVHPSSSYNPLKSWKPHTDCCFWEGITCDGTTGHVVGLDLYDSSLNGSIHSNSSLFHLHHLQMLNLSRNAFDYFAPSGFDKLPRLVHLILSNNYFSGGIPSQISQLTDLVSLDLSWNQFGGQIPSVISRLTKLVFLDLSDSESSSQLEIPNLGAFVQNLSNLRELHLDGVNLSAQKNRDWCHRLSSALSNLHVLSMSNCSLTGSLDASISSLHFLSEFYLDRNENLSSTVPSSLANLTLLTVFNLQNCGFHGDFPSNVFHQPNLTNIDLSSNPLLSVHLPEFPQGNNSLRYLNVGGTKFQGKFPGSEGNLKFLKGLYLNNCNFSGPIPPSFANLTHLTDLDISENSLSGPIPSFFKEKFPNLEHLWLEGNLLQGSIPSYWFYLPSLFELDLSNNQFSGVINEPIHNISSFSSLEELWLEGNLLQGPIPSYLFYLPSLSVLDLSNNQFSGVINEPIHNISSFSRPDIYLTGNCLKGQDLRSISKFKGTFGVLDLSFNDFGDYIVEDTNLSYGSLSVNRSGDNSINIQIQGLMMRSCNLSKFPDFLRNQKELIELDLSSNRIDGPIPKWIWQKNLSLLYLSNNSLTGLELPLPNHSFNIKELDLSSNMIEDCLSATAPCFPRTFNQSNSEFVSPVLENLMRSLLSKARFLSISNNTLTGNIPFTICNALYLEILDLSNNQLSGTIPTCIDSSNLGVLNLERNKLHGPIPPRIFTSGCSLHALKLSNNILQGHVPRSLANCKELEVLDIGDNHLNGTFPYWLENLSKLRVLVMRSNNFGGPIGQHCHVDSPFPNLHVFDLSFNTFTGNLPLQYILHWKAMMTNEDESELNYIGFESFRGYYYQDTIAIVDKGIYLEMGSIITTFTTIDLSNNKFNGGDPRCNG